MPKASSLLIIWKDLPVLQRWFLGLVAFSLFGVTMGATTGVQAPWLARISSAALILTAVFSLFPTRSLWKWAILLLLIGGISEILGVYTGWVFGDYVYTQKWWPTIALPVPSNNLEWRTPLYPLVLPFAWIMVVGACQAVLPDRITGKGRALLAATIATLYDFALMEPVMVSKLQYWAWRYNEDGLPFGVPWHNYAGWWITSLLAAGVLSKLDPADLPRRRKAGAIILSGYSVLLLTLWALWKPGS